MALMSLNQLLNVAIEPEVGVINLRALHSLLQGVLGQLDLRQLPGRGKEEQLGTESRELSAQGKEEQSGAETRELSAPGKEEQLGAEKGDGSKDTGQEPGKDLQETAGDSQVASQPAHMQMKKDKSKDSGISKAMNLSQDLMGQVGGVKAAQSRMEEDIRTIQEALALGNFQGNIGKVVADIRDQVASLEGMANELQGQKGKIKQLEDALSELAVAGEDSKADDSSPVSLGAMLQETKEELKELREKQEAMKSTLMMLVVQLDELKKTMESMEKKQEECPVCSADIGVQVGQLLQRYEKLQETVDTFTTQHLVQREKQLQEKSQQEKESMQLIQATIGHLQGDCKKLSSVTGNLLSDSQQKQKDIEALFQSVEKLEKDKSDKEDLLLRMDEKADKSALASKVSHSQFEANMERLNDMIQEMLNRVTGQEQDWHQLQQQIGEEMESKLDRVELGSFRQQLEEQWKSILDKVEKKGLLIEGDDAAGIKKQLLAPFSCLSCDCPLKMLVPGPDMMSIPCMPPMPAQFSVDPDASLKQEQMSHLMLREQVASGRYQKTPRPCGGRHTLTQPLQHRQTLLLQAPSPLPRKHKTIDLLGQDGHIYRGQQDEQLPVLVGKEVFLKEKSKLSPRQRDAQDSGRLLARPQSQGCWRSQMGTPASPEDQPAPPQSNLSQALELLLTPGNGSRAPSAAPPPPQPRRRR